MHWRKIEWQTLLLFICCYGLWLLTTYQFNIVSDNWGLATACLMLFTITALLTAFHTSLQHEVVHGHPTPWSVVNEALVFPSLIFVYPFRRYRDLHLKHHNDANLTDPYEDPESYFWPQTEGHKLNKIKWLLLSMNNTFVGRMLLGPPLGLWGFYKTEISKLWRGEKGVRLSWSLHIIGCVCVVSWLTFVCAIPLWLYACLVIYPAVSWILIRSFAEHRADKIIGKRSAIVEAHPFFALLFLNNNLHIVHHAHPEMAWHELPMMYAQNREKFLTANGGYLYTGYGSIVRQFAFRKKQPVFHPFSHRKL